MGCNHHVDLIYFLWTRSILRLQYYIHIASNITYGYDVGGIILGPAKKSPVKMYF
jgi:hypothetical protein